MQHTNVGSAGRDGQQDATVDALNGLLRGEISAVETYDKALPVVLDKPVLLGDLQDCRASHESRVERIRRAIVAVGGEPTQTSGPWGRAAKAVTGGARILGWKHVLTTLEELEDHELKEYGDALERLDDPMRALVTVELYPEQVRTHEVMATLKRSAFS